MNRRRFMESTVAAGAIAGAGIAAWTEASAAAPPSGGAGVDDSRLPDGNQFPRWEQPLSFTKTYYVNNTSAAADDNGPGDQARPFRTISKAAEVLQPGERVVIAAGVYRETVRPARGGTGPTQMISYEAAPGAKVYIRGSDVLKDGWQQQSVRWGFGAGATDQPVTIWRHDLPPSLFPDGYNPFALISLMPSWSWLDTKIVDMGPYLRRRGLVFAGGKPLEPMEQTRELAMPQLPGEPDYTKPAVSVNGQPPRRRGAALMQEIGGVANARFAIENTGRAIFVRLASGTPADQEIEVTTRQHVFLPVNPGTNYIRLKGLTFQHCANSFPYPQYGMVSPAGGHHWILEDNTLEWANGMAIELGTGGNSAGAERPGWAHVIRRNTFRYCGIEGIGGMGTTDTLIEDNLIEWVGWADAERGWEAAGAKFHRAKNMMFRRNVIRHMRHANAAWWDVDNVNCRITRNVMADVVSVGAALHIEMTPDQNAIDNNIIWDVRNGEPGTPGQRGCAGSGIFDNSSDNLLITQNLIGRCNNAGIFGIVRPDRGMPNSGKGNTVANNIFVKNGGAGIVFLNRDNKADGNVYVDMPREFQGFFEGTPSATYDPDAWQKIKYRDLASWRDTLGWDKNSVMAQAQIEFDPDKLELTIAPASRLPRVAAIPGYQSDMLRKPTGATRAPGPLANPEEQRVWRVDPRVMA